MKILVYPHDLELGGSQLNAIELAGAVRDLGHDVLLYGRRGVLNERIDELGLDFVESPPPGVRPTPRIAADLRRLVESRRLDVVHGYEWPPVLEARLAVAGTPAVCVGTVMSMAVAPFIPKHLPLVVGTEQIAAVERGSGRRNVTVIEPPVDTAYNSSEMAADGWSFRQELGLPFEAIHVVCVTRLARELKLEGLLTAIEVVGQLDSLVTLTIVGDGPAAQQVRAAAVDVNGQLGRPAVLLTGQLEDPRAAYASADVVLGMGGSALRALAFGKPLVVQGEQGFWRTLTPDSLPTFLWTGWYGSGDGAAGGADALRRELFPLLSKSWLRAELGEFGRQTVAARFSLGGAAHRQLATYQRAVSHRDHSLSEPLQSVTAAARLVTHVGGQLALSRLGRAAADDFNAIPAASPPGPLSSAELPLVVHIAGVPWEGLEGSEHRLIEHLVDHFPVLWVDPVRPARHIQPSTETGALGVAGLSRLHEGLWHLSVAGPPGVTRPLIRDVALARLQHRVRRSQLALGASRFVALGASPLFPLGSIDADRRIFYATDDFSAGAGLMKMSEERLRRLWMANVRSADLVLAVSPILEQQLRLLGAPVHLLPNGCAPERFAGGEAGPAAEVALPGPVAGVIGQLNDRIDTSLLLAVAKTGASLLLVGPVSARGDRPLADYSALLKYPNVQWVGAQPYTRIASFSAAIDVGLTPYRDTAFNRASFPLKTLEYLAAGLPVVSTDLPSGRWLNTPLIRLADSKGYVSEVMEALREPQTAGAAHERRAFAAAHSWEARAQTLADLIAATEKPHCLASISTTYEESSV